MSRHASTLRRWQKMKTIVIVVYDLLKHSRDCEWRSLTQAMYSSVYVPLLATIIWQARRWTASSACLFGCETCMSDQADVLHHSSNDCCIQGRAVKLRLIWFLQEPRRLVGRWDNLLIQHLVFDHRSIVRIKRSQFFKCTLMLYDVSQFILLMSPLADQAVHMQFSDH